MTNKETLAKINSEKYRSFLSEDNKYRIFIDDKTSKEVYRELHVRLGDQLTRVEALENRKKKFELEKNFQWNKKSGFIQIKRAIKEIVGKARQYHSHLFMKLLPLVSFDDKPIALRGKPLNQTKIASYLGIQRKVAKDFLNDFIEMNILQECEGELNNEKFYKLSTKYIIKGKFEEHEVYSVKVLQEELKKAIELIENETMKYINRQKKKKMNLYPLSLLLMLLPYVHPQTHILCKNYEDNFLEKHSTIHEALRHNKKLVKRLTDKQIWNEMTGQDVKKLSSDNSKKLKIYFEILKRTNVISSLEGKNKIYIMNPNLVFVMAYSKDEAWIQTLKDLFTILEE